VRFVGEPVAVVVARNRYLAEDAAEHVQVRYEPLPVVLDPERALENGAPVLHEAVGSNLAGHRRLVYGDPDRAFREAEVVLDERFTFPKYGSTPIETYGVIATWDPLDGVCTVWSNFMGPFIMHPLTRACWGWPRTSCASSSHPTSGLVRHQVVDLPVHRADRAGGDANRRAGQVDRGPARAPAGVVEWDGSGRVPRGRRQERRDDPRHAVPVAR